MFITLTDSIGTDTLINVNRIDYIRIDDGGVREDLKSVVIFDKETWICVKETIQEIHKKIENARLRDVR